MQKYLLLVSLLLTGFLFSSCKKWELTNDTQEGANTFSCITDGQVFKPCGTRLLFGNPPLYGVAGNASGSAITCYVYASCSEASINKQVQIELSGFRGTGQYPLGNNSNLLKYLEEGRDVFYTSKGGSGIINITKDDRNAHILSGTFYGTLVDGQGSGKMIEVKDGRFDIRTQ